MAAIDRLDWFISNVAEYAQPELRDWLNSERLTIQQMKTENERQRAAKQLVDEYMQSQHVD